MKALVLVGVLLILLGVLALAYQSITYTTHEKVAELGPFKATVDREKQIAIPPLAGGAAIAAGVILVVLGVRKRG